MSQVKTGDTVKVHYTGKFEDGTVFDTSNNRDPLCFTIGEGQVILGFERAVVGMSLGESKTTKVLSDEAYGPYRKEMIVVLPRNQIPADLEPKVGQPLQMVNQVDGRRVIATVIDVSESEVTLDANHPLAGKDLTFDIQLIEIV